MSLSLAPSAIHQRGPLSCQPSGAAMETEAPTRNPCGGEQSLGRAGGSDRGGRPAEFPKQRLRAAGSPTAARCQPHSSLAAPATRLAAGLHKKAETPQSAQALGQRHRSWRPDSAQGQTGLRSEDRPAFQGLPVRGPVTATLYMAARSGPCTNPAQPRPSPLASVSRRVSQKCLFCPHMPTDIGTGGLLTSEPGDRARHEDPGLLGLPGPTAAAGPGEPAEMWGCTGVRRGLCLLTASAA